MCKLIVYKNCALYLAAAAAGMGHNQWNSMYKYNVCNSISATAGHLLFVSYTVIVINQAGTFLEYVNIRFLSVYMHGIDIFP